MCADDVAVFGLHSLWEFYDVKETADVTAVGDVRDASSHPCSDSRKHTRTLASLKINLHRNKSFESLTRSTQCPLLALDHSHNTALSQRCE